MLTARRPPSQVLVSARLWTVEQISYLCKMHQGIRKGLTAANQIPCCAECTQHKRNNTEKVTLFQQNSQRIPLQTCGLPICFLKKGHFFFFSPMTFWVCVYRRKVRTMSSSGRISRIYPQIGLNLFRNRHWSFFCTVSSP